jgi:hypothetical protein
MNQTHVLSDTESVIYSTGIERGRFSERDACAALVENLRMDEILLAMGELSAQERRNCKALLGYVAHRIRSRAASATADSPEGASTHE